MHFPQWKLVYFFLKLIKICFREINKQESNIGSDNGLAPNRRQAIILTNDGFVYWRIYPPVGLDELSVLQTQWRYYIDIPMQCAASILDIQMKPNINQRCLQGQIQMISFLTA